MADRFSYLSSAEQSQPTGIWGWAKRLVDELNKFKLFELIDTSLIGQGGRVIKVKANESGYELAPDIVGGGGGGGGVDPTVVVKIAGYTETVITGHQVALCDLAAGFTVTLPTAVGSTGMLTYKKIQAAGLITIDANGAETIDGAATAVLNNEDEAITLVSDGASNWDII